MLVNKEKTINWKIAAQNTIYRRNTSVSCLEPDHVIDDMIGLVKTIDRIV